MSDLFLTQGLTALVIGVASGSIGAFIILKRMALVGDALSHVALPGIALALAYGIDPFWGVLFFLLAAAIFIWWLEKNTKLSTDTLVGLLFTASLAIGILTIPNTEIVESLFGTFPSFTPLVLALVLGTSLFLVILIFLWTKRFAFSIVAPELAAINKKDRLTGLLLLLIFSFIVSLGIKLAGTLLMGALTIIPAAVAKNIAKSMKAYLILSSVMGGIISLGGVFVAKNFGFLPGPTIVLLGVAIFCASLIFVRK